MIMNEIHDRLANELLKVNQGLSYHQARTWVEMLWEDFETTRAKAGYSYKGAEVTESIVMRLIQNYGPNLHEFAARNPKYAHLLNEKGLEQ